MNHETEEKKMKRMRKADVEKLERETSPWVYRHYGEEEMSGLWDPSDEDFARPVKEGAKVVNFSFAKDIPRDIEWARQFPELEGIRFSDCFADNGGMESYAGLRDFPNLRFLNFRDSGTLDGETLRMIAGLPRLEGLALSVQRIDAVASLRELAACRSLRALEIGVWAPSEDDGPWVEDLQFLSELPLLENLDLSACRRVDLSKFTLPPALKVFTVPNYTAADVKRRFREKCAVIKGCVMHRPCRYRFFRERSPKRPRAVQISEEPLGGLFAGMEDDGRAVKREK